MSDRDSEVAKAAAAAAVCKSEFVGESSPFDLSVMLGSADDSAATNDAALDRSGPRSLGMIQMYGDCMHLSRSLLVKLKLRMNGCEPVSILCTTENISSSGMLVSLPCQLGLTPGALFDMDLYVGSENESVSLQGRARRVARIGTEDLVTYALEVDFHKMNMLAEKQIAAFIHSAQVDNFRMPMAQ